MSYPSNLPPWCTLSVPFYADEIRYAEGTVWISATTPAVLVSPELRLYKVVGNFGRAQPWPETKMCIRVPFFASPHK